MASSVAWRPRIGRAHGFASPPFNGFAFLVMARSIFSLDGLYPVGLALQEEQTLQVNYKSSQETTTYFPLFSSIMIQPGRLMRPGGIKAVDRDQCDSQVWMSTYEASVDQLKSLLE